MRIETKIKKKGLHHKLVEFSAGLWFHMIKWGHPKIVTPEASRSAPLATPLQQAFVVMYSSQLSCFLILLKAKLLAAFMTSFQ